MNISLGAIIERTAARFEDAGLVFGHGWDSAWDEAVALALHVTALPDDQSALDTAIDADMRSRIEQLANRRIAERIPLAYVLGRCSFMGLEFLIEPGIVIPRSPIGGLLGEALSPWVTREPEHILDVCTGSGCIGLLAALVWPKSRVTLVDIDPAAVALARRNIALHGLSERVIVVQSDLFERLPASQRFDLVLSNPPYVDAEDMATLPPEYRHEPALGLDGGADGNDLVRRMLIDLPNRLRPGGLFVCEVGASAQALQDSLPMLPFLWPELPTGGEGVFLLWREDLALLEQNSCGKD